MFSLDDKELQAEINRLRTAIPEAAEAGGGAALKELMERLRDRVIQMIPNKGGWYDLYKKSIKVVDKGSDQYELTTTVAEISFGDIDAENSVITISGDDEASILIGQNGPWTVDTLPALADGINGTLQATPDVSEVNTIRTRQLANRSSIVNKLKNLGVTVLPFDGTLPKVNGRVYADVPFLAMRLEYGLGGFPRTPIWSRIVTEAETLSKSKAVIERGQGVFAERWVK